MGDTACLCYPMDNDDGADPSSMLYVLRQDLMCGWKIRDEIEEGRCVSNHYTGGMVGKSNPPTIIIQGFSSRINARVTAGQGARGVTAPFGSGDEPLINTPSGWMGWIRQLAQTSYETDRPVYNPRYARFLDENRTFWWKCSGRCTAKYLSSGRGEQERLP